MKFVLVVLAVLAVLFPPAAFAQPRPLDTFEDVSPWTTAPSDGVLLKVSKDDGALRLDFNFQGGAGYAVARRPLSLDLPANWEITFRLRAEAPVNNLEFKLIDPTGENVWWVNRRNFEFPRDWRLIRIKKRQLEFAWGPIGGGEMKKAASLETAITAGTGGKGTVWIDDLTFTELPPTHPYDRTPAAISGPDWFGLDFLESREYGGLVIDWEPGALVSYAVEISDDGKSWTAVRQVKDGNGGRDYLYLPETESRYLRLRGAAPQKAQIDVKPLDWAPTINDFFKVIAKDTPRGFYPRAFFGEQPYWTVVGADGDPEEGLLSEDGALEVGQGGFSIEPFLLLDDEVVTWANVQTSQTLAEGYLPIPTVTWEARGGLSLEITALASPSDLWARYRVRNRGDRTIPLSLVLALRPFQVNPPTQFLNAAGGVSPIREIGWEGVAVVNGTRRVLPSPSPNGFSFATFDGGEISEYLQRGKTYGSAPPVAKVTDPFGYASGALVWHMDLPAGGERAVDLTVPFASAATPARASMPGLVEKSPLKGTQSSRVHPAVSHSPGIYARAGAPSTENFETFDDAYAAAVRDWHERLDRVEIRLPPRPIPS